MRFFIPLAILASIAYGADFTTYIGDQNQYQVAAVAADSAGNSYVTGSRVIESAPALSSDDVFVTELDPNGNIVFTTTFGGKGSDIGNSIAVDQAGNIWVGGSTSSENFPLRDALQTAQGSGNPGGTGFLVKLASDGTVIYSSYFGGLLGSSSVNGVATDQSGNVYVTGATDSTDFPTTAGLPAGKVNGERNHAFLRRVHHQAGCHRPTRPLFRCNSRQRGGLRRREQLLPFGAQYFGRRDCPGCGGRRLYCRQHQHHRSAGDDRNFFWLWSVRRRDQCRWKPTGLFDLLGSRIRNARPSRAFSTQSPRAPSQPTPQAMPI